jgi:hypothetical protein
MVGALIKAIQSLPALNRPDTRWHGHVPGPPARRIERQVRYAVLLGQLVSHVNVHIV